MKHLTVACIGVCIALVGCTQSAEERAVVEETTALKWERVLPDLMTETQQTQQELMLTAAKALATELMGELSAALAAGGPSAAIGVCREKAPSVAAQVSDTYGLEIGRTSHRLRNPANVAPAWADAYVADLVEDPTYLAGPNGELGALLPIRLKAACQMCHGPAEEIDQTIQATLAEDYPDDQAVGFAEGDLRGWLWVEAPPDEVETEM
jgi:hypothetical protein